MHINTLKTNVNLNGNVMLALLTNKTES